MPVHGLMQFDGSWVNFDGQTPFIRAALSGDIEVMRLLLQHGADPNIATAQGSTALMAAAGINWIPAQTYTPRRGRLRRGREAVPGARRSRECHQLARPCRHPWGGEPRVGVGDSDPRRPRREARCEGQRRPDADDVRRRNLPRHPAAGGEAGGDGAAEEADGRARATDVGLRKMKHTLLAGAIVFVAAGVGSLSSAMQQPAAPARRPGGFARTASSRRRCWIRYCVTCHNDDAEDGRPALDTLSLDRTGADAETWEKVVRKVRAGLMPPAGARRPPRASLDAFAGAIEGAIDRARGRRSESRADAAASHEPRRVRQRDPRSARAGRRSLDAASSRRFEPRLRQHRRRAGRVAVAPRTLRVRGGEDQQAGRRRARCGAGAGHLHGQRRSEPEPDARGPAARHARRHDRPPQLPGRRRVPDQAVAAEAQFRSGLRRGRRRRGARGDAERRAREAVQARRSPDVLHARSAGLASAEASRRPIRSRSG